MNRLRERSVLVTRPGGPDDPLTVRLAAAGLRVHAVPTVVIGPLAAGGALDRAVERLEQYRWVAVTSVHGVEALAAAMAWAKTSARPRIAAVGAATARAATEAGMIVAAVAEDGTGAGIAAAIGRAEGAAATGRAGGAALGGLRILLPRASAASGDLPAALRGAGAEVDEVVAYETVEAPPASAGPLHGALADPSLALVAVASGSAVRGLVALAEMSPGSAARLRELPFVSIGPSTSGEVRRLGLRLAAEAARPSADSLADSVIDVVGALPSSSHRSVLEVPR